MGQHLVNLFRIINPKQLSLSYRLYEVKLPPSRTLQQNLQRVRTYVAREYGTPAVIIKQNDCHQVVVSSSPTKQAIPAILDVPVLQGLSAQLCALPGVRTISDLGSLTDDDERNTAAAFISFALQGRLFANHDLWRGASRTIWYSRDSELPSQRNVALYPGYSFRVLWIRGVGFCLALDISHLFADTRTLADRMAAGDDWHMLSGRHFLYEMGQQWFSIQLQKVLDQPINQARFPHPDGSGRVTNVYEYTVEKYNGQAGRRFRPVRPTDHTIIYNYPGGSDDRQAAATLARLRYRTDDQEVSSLQQHTTLVPHERFRRVCEAVAKYFDGAVSFDGNKVQISHEPLQIDKRIFPVPSQRFGNNHILASPGTLPKGLEDMWRQRKAALRDTNAGFVGTEGISTQFILFPMSAGESLIEQIKQDVTSAVNQISPFEYDPKTVIWDDRGVQSVADLRKALASPKEQMEKDDAACALVVLPAQWSSGRAGTMRRHIKKLLHPRVKAKCVQLSEVRRYLDVHDSLCSVRPDTQHKYQNYLFLTALDVLVTSGYQPWALADPLQYDLYIGVDVLYNTAAFTFIACGGIIFRFRAIQTEQKEKISSKLMREQILTNLKDLIPRIKEVTGVPPRHVVVHRDGRLYDSEQDGFTQAIKELKLRGLLDDEARFGAVEIHKSQAARLRMAARLDSGSLVNAQVGSYYLFDKASGLLLTTGHPARLPGTADPIVANVVLGDLDIISALKDIYWLSTLAWSKPDSVQRQPVTIKLADDWLDAVAGKTSEDDEISDAPSDDTDSDFE